MSLSPIPCPKHPTQPRMLRWLSVPTTIVPGFAAPCSMLTWEPIPASTSKTRTPVSRAKRRQTCWFSAYPVSRAGTLQSKVNTVFSTSSTQGASKLARRFFTTFAPPKSRALRTSIEIHTTSPAVTGFPACAERIFSMIVFPVRISPSQSFRAISSATSSVVFAPPMS